MTWALSSDEIYGVEGRDRTYCFACRQALTLLERMDGAVVYNEERGLRHEKCPPPGTHPGEAEAVAVADSASSAWWKDP